MAEREIRELDTKNVKFEEKKRILFFGLPWTFTKYSLTDDVIVRKAGLLKTTEDDCYMYKVQDVKLTRTLLEKMCGVGTVVCYTGDSTDHELVLEHIKNAKEIKDFILAASEAARLRRRTVNMLDIGNELDCDGGFHQF